MYNIASGSADQEKTHDPQKTLRSMASRLLSYHTSFKKFHPDFRFAIKDFEEMSRLSRELAEQLKREDA